MEVTINAAGAAKLSVAEGTKIQCDWKRAEYYLNNQWGAITDRNDRPTKTLPFTFELTRSAATDPYTAGDCMVGTTANSFLNVALNAGANVTIVGIQAQTNDAGLKGQTVKVHWLNEAITPIADNAAYVRADPAKARGDMSLTFDNPTTGDAFAYDDFVNKSINPVTKDIPFQLEVPAFTPTAASYIKFKILCQLSY